jgi:imidazolonepropionase-like amidohydrolase
MALKALTINGAKILGLDHRIGSLKKGKDADIVITNKEVLDPRFLVKMTIISGEIVYEHKSREDLYI